ncbi:hypothetical protein GCM10009573_32670 [Agromyces bracchium]
MAELRLISCVGQECSLSEWNDRTHIGVRQHAWAGLGGESFKDLKIRFEKLVHYAEFLKDPVHGAHAIFRSVQVDQGAMCCARNVLRKELSGISIRNARQPLH